MFTQSLVAQATSVLERYYGAAHVEPPFPLSQLGDQLVQLGAADDQDLRDLSWENLQALGIPLLQAQRISVIFRSGAAASSGPQTMVMRTIADEVSELGHADLLTRFAQNPTALHSAVAEQIRARSGNMPCIALTADGQIDVATSAKVLDGIAVGDNYGQTFRVDGKPRYLYRLGEISNPIRNAHPVFTDKTLQLDGADHYGIYWGNIPLECQQLIWLAHNETHELKVPDREGLMDLRDRAEQGMNTLAERYPQAFRLFEERKELGSLPALRTRLSSRTAAKVG